MRITTITIAALATSLVGAKRLLPEKHISPHALAKVACLEHNTPEICDGLIKLNGGESGPTIAEREARAPEGIAMDLATVGTVYGSVTGMGESIGRNEREMMTHVKIAIPTTLARVVVGDRYECLQLGGCGEDAFTMPPFVEREARIPHAITGDLDIIENVPTTPAAMRESIDQRESETMTDVSIAIPTTLARVFAGHREKLPCLQLGGCGDDALTMPPFVERDARNPNAIEMDLETLEAVPTIATATRGSIVAVPAEINVDGSIAATMDYGIGP